MIDQLRQQHDELQSINERLDKLVGASTPDLPALFPLRLAMSALLRKHIALEEEHIYAPLRKHPDVAEEMRRSDEDIASRRAAYSTHVNHWTPDRIASDWSRYRTEVIALTLGLKGRIAYEEDVIYPLFDRILGAGARA